MRAAMATSAASALVLGLPQKKCHNVYVEPNPNDPVRKVALVEPLQKQLKLKKTKLEEVLKAYNLAADYGVAEVTTAALREGLRFAPIGALAAVIAPELVMSQGQLITTWAGLSLLGPDLSGATGCMPTARCAMACCTAT